MLGGLELHRVFFVLVAQLLDVGMAVQRVVVEVHLGVERDHVAVAGYDQRVHLDHRCIQVHERVVHGNEKLGRALDLVAFQTQAESDLAGVERHDAGRRIDGDRRDFLGCLFRDGLDVHAALGRGNDHDP